MSVTLEAVLGMPKLFQPCDLFADRSTAKVELATANKEDKGSISRIHFMWNEVVSFWRISADDAKKLSAAGFKPVPSTTKDDDDKGFFNCYVMRKRISHLWFMNFRRYGWCWTPEEGGEYGYAHGHVYTNGPVFNFEHNIELNNSEHKIRDSLLVSWKEMFTKDHLPGFFNCYSVQQVIGTLLREALDNRTDHSLMYPVREDAKAPEWNVPVKSVVREKR